MSERINIAQLRESAQRTLSQGDDWLPYEETWHEMTTGVLALVEAVEAAAKSFYGPQKGHIRVANSAALEAALARFDFGDAA